MLRAFRRWTPIWVLLGAFALSTASTALAAPAAQPFDLEEDVEECSTEWVPDPVEIPVTGSWEEPVVLDVYFLLNHLETFQGIEIVEKLNDFYAPLGIQLAAQYEEVAWERDAHEATFVLNEPVDVIDSTTLLQNAKDHFGGVRPWGTDAVYVLSGMEISGSVAGQADCVGGVRLRNSAFAVGEAEWDAASDYPELRSAKIAAHELAHLLGAHHHYANCAEAAAQSLIELTATPCTVMFNDIGLVSRYFSTVEAAVVRGHALKYAAHTPTGPPEPVARTLSLWVQDGFGEGLLNADEGSIECLQFAEVQLQRFRKRTWNTIDLTDTNDEQRFGFEWPTRAGRYRAMAPEVEVGPDEDQLCLEAVSKALRVR